MPDSHYGASCSSVLLFISEPTLSFDALKGLDMGYCKIKDALCVMKTVYIKDTQYGSYSIITSYSQLYLQNIKNIFL